MARWYERIPNMLQGGNEPWPPYIRGLVMLERGQVVEAITQARAAVQRSREAGHQKMEQRSRVLLAHALAEHMDVAGAQAAMPPVSERVDKQDMIYDLKPRVRVHEAVGDLVASDEDAKRVTADVCAIGSPVDAVAEGTRDAAWLRSFIEQIAWKGQVVASPRIALARGRLALYEGNLAEAVDQLRRAEAGFVGGGFLLDAWHAARALAEAEMRAGDASGAARRLDGIIAAAEPAGALLAAKLARDAAAAFGLEISAPPARPNAPSQPRVATGERMVSVLFADVRGYTEMAGQTPPSDLADRIASLQRWARLEVERRHGLVDKFAGDAIMATFNVSGQTVDHSVQAVRAAVAIIDKAALAGLPVGAGVAVGPAVVGNLAEGANLSVLGEVTNLAARLQAQAAAGQVLVAADVYRRVEEWLVSQRIQVDRVELELKGIGERVVAYRLTTEVPAAAVG